MDPDGRCIFQNAANGRCPRDANAQGFYCRGHALQSHLGALEEDMEELDHWGRFCTLWHWMVFAQDPHDDFHVPLSHRHPNCRVCDTHREGCGPRGPAL